TGSADPAGYDIVINATPLGMKKDDPLPFAVERISPKTFVGEVVMKEEITPFLAAVRAKGCDYQVGTDMLFEQIPAYLEFFGFGTTTSDELRELAQIHYLMYWAGLSNRIGEHDDRFDHNGFDWRRPRREAQDHCGRRRRDHAAGRIQGLWRAECRRPSRGANQGSQASYHAEDQLMTLSCNVGGFQSFERKH